MMSNNSITKTNSHYMNITNFCENKVLTHEMSASSPEGT